MHILKILWYCITGNWWVIKRCGFPFERGWAVWNTKTNTIIYTGLTKEHAKHICKKLNFK